MSLQAVGHGVPETPRKQAITVAVGYPLELDGTVELCGQEPVSLGVIGSTTPVFLRKIVSNYLLNYYPCTHRLVQPSSLIPHQGGVSMQQMTSNADSQNWWKCREEVTVECSAQNGISGSQFISPRRLEHWRKWGEPEVGEDC